MDCSGWTLWPLLEQQGQGFVAHCFMVRARTAVLAGVGEIPVVAGVGEIPVVAGNFTCIYLSQTGV